MAVTWGTSANARSVWMRIGTPASSRNCLGAVNDEWPAVIRVPRPAAGRITYTRINKGVYQLKSSYGRVAKKRIANEREAKERVAKRRVAKTFSELQLRVRRSVTKLPDRTSGANGKGSPGSPSPLSRCPLFSYPVLSYPPFSHPLLSFSACILDGSIAAKMNARQPRTAALAGRERVEKSMNTKVEIPAQADFAAEVQEWIEAFDDVVVAEGPEQGAELLEALRKRAREAGITPSSELTTPYHNTIPKHEEVPYPGDRTLERRVESLIRWNAMAMVHSQNKKDPGIGGHLATYSSLATLLEVGFNHFFHATHGDQPGDLIYFQGHASTGIYARAYLLGRFDEQRLLNFRHELRGEPGLSSYPHPWLMPDFWRFPTVSMGIGPLNAIYQARFMRYLENRGLIEKTDRKVWAFVGDGETDEPESMGSLTLGAREKLDNLIFVVNCNLQRLDGPVRGNGKIVNELEAAFRGAGWNVIKVLWGSDWDRLLEKDKSGLLMKRFEEVVDGELQSYKARGGAYIRKEFFGKYPELLEMVSDLSDDELHRLTRGGHDPQKVYNAYKRAVEHTGSPTVILAQTVKGYGLGSAEARNATHSEKKLADQALSAFRTRFEIPIPE